MPYTRPTLEALIARRQTDLASAFGLGALLPQSSLAVLAGVVALSQHELNGFCEWSLKQGNPLTCEGPALSEWASAFGVPRRPAAYASGSVTFTGTVGSTIGAGVKVRRADGQEYAVLVGGTFIGGTLTLTVEAVLAGNAGDADAGTTLLLSSPVAGVQTGAVVAAGGLSQGADAESDSDLRARLLERLRVPPSSGSPSDFVRWARSVPGVTRAWAFRDLSQLGSVDVCFATDNEASPIPTPSKVAEVQAVLNANAPLQSRPVAFAPAAKPINFSIDDLQPDTAAVRLAIEAALRQLLVRVGAPGQPLRLSHCREAISNAPGERDHVLVSPAANVAVTTGELPVLGVVTWL